MRVDVAVDLGGRCYRILCGCVNLLLSLALLWEATVRLFVCRPYAALDLLHMAHFRRVLDSDVFSYPCSVYSPGHTGRYSVSAAAINAVLGCEHKLA